MGGELKCEGESVAVTVERFSPSSDSVGGGSVGGGVIGRGGVSGSRAPDASNVAVVVAEADVGASRCKDAVEAPRSSRLWRVLGLCGELGSWVLVLRLTRPLKKPEKRFGERDYYEHSQHTTAVTEHASREGKSMHPHR
jgi:hypothetical protein